MRALETRGSQSDDLLQLVSFNLAEEEYALPILAAHP
jgi:chemotaxis signal transduction protein